jgi:hypothetical protein
MNPSTSTMNSIEYHATSWPALFSLNRHKTTIASMKLLSQLAFSLDKPESLSRANAFPLMMIPMQKYSLVAGSAQLRQISRSF